MHLIIFKGERGEPGERGDDGPAGAKVTEFIQEYFVTNSFYF